MSTPDKHSRDAGYTQHAPNCGLVHGGYRSLGYNDKATATNGPVLLGMQFSMPEILQHIYQNGYTRLCYSNKHAPNLRGLLQQDIFLIPLKV